MSDPLARKSELPGNSEVIGPVGDRPASVSLGDFINGMLTPQTPARPSPVQERPLGNRALDVLTERIAAAEERSASTASHIEQSIQSLAARLETSDVERHDSERNVAGALEELRRTHEELRQSIPQASGYPDAAAAESVAALEQALKALATDVDHTQTRLAEQINTTRADSERQNAGAARRLQSLELALPGLVDRLNTAESKVDGHLQSIEQNVVKALSTMQNSIVNMQGRLGEAEAQTDEALIKLDVAFKRLDSRVENIAATAGPDEGQALRQMFDQRFDQLNADLRAQVSAVREEFAVGIEQAAGPQGLADMRRLEDILAGLTARLGAVENGAQPDGKLEALAATVEARIGNFDTLESTFRETIGTEMSQLAERLDKRVTQSEERSAEAIEQVGEQVATIAGRLQARQDEALEGLSEQLAASDTASKKRLTDALDSVAARLDAMEEQSVTAMSPVQRAIASLARRVEAIEGGTAREGRPITPEPRAIPDPSPAPERVEVPVPPPANIVAEPTSTPADFAVPEMTPPPSSDQGHSAFQPLPMSEFATTSPAELDSMPDFESGFEDWPASEASLLKREGSEGSPRSPFETVDTPPAPDDGESFMVDPLSDLDELDSLGASEVRDSDVFDPAIEPPVTDDQINIVETPQQAAETLDYIARARQAALDASVQQESDHSKKKTSGAVSDRKIARGGLSPGNLLPENFRAPRLPVMAAVSIVAVATAGTFGFLSMRGSNEQDEFALRSTPSDASLAGTLAALDAGNDTVSSPDSDVAATDGDPSAIEDLLFETDTEARELPPAENAADPLSLASAISIVPVPAENDVADVPARPLSLVPPTPSLEASASQGNRAAQFLIGLAALEAGNITEGVESIQAAADAGLPVAQYRLAKLHEAGQGVPRDFVVARGLAEAAAKGGNVKAMHDYAAYLASGDGGSQSYTEAIEWFRRAAEFGVVDSQFNLGQMYERGLGVTSDLEEALFWMEVARTSGDDSTVPIIRSLRSRLSQEQGEAIIVRARAWAATTPEGPANGSFPPPATNSAYRSQVLAVQSALNRFGYDAGPADGVMGARTRDAIRAYQNDQDLSRTGAIDAELIARLNEAISAGQS